MPRRRSTRWTCSPRRRMSKSSPRSPQVAGARLDCAGRRRYHWVMQVEMVVAGLTIDPVNNAPIVILREKEGGRIVPIWIGAVEASAIAFELEEIKLARPM